MSTHDPYAVLTRMRQAQPPTTPEGVRDRLNTLERIVGSLTPSDDLEQAILEVLNEQNRILEQLTGGVADKPGTSILELPDEAIPLLQEANIRLEEIVRGTVSTTGLPVGLSGTATTDIQNGETGVGIFDFSGGRYAALVTADEDVDQFDTIRVKDPEENLVTPIATEQELGELEAPQNRRQEYDVTIGGAAENILDRSVRPRTEGSSLRVTVDLDTTTTFARRVIPDDDDVASFTSTFNQGGDLDDNSVFEFTFDADPDARYNFRMGAAGTVREIRVQELLVSQ